MCGEFGFSREKAAEKTILTVRKLPGKSLDFQVFEDSFFLIKNLQIFDKSVKKLFDTRPRS